MKCCGFTGRLAGTFPQCTWMPEYGDGFYQAVSTDLQDVFPEVHSFSVTNLKYMKYFYELYPNAQNRPWLTEGYEAFSNRQQLVDDLRSAENRQRVVDDLGEDWLHFLFRMQAGTE